MMSDDYDFELDRVVEEIKKNKAERIGLQFPEGLKQHAVDIAREIEDKTKAKAIIFIGPTYGACDLKEEVAEKMKVDMIVHFGHTEFRKGGG